MVAVARIVMAVSGERLDNTRSGISHSVLRSLPRHHVARARAPPLNKQWFCIGSARILTIFSYLLIELVCYCVRDLRIMII